MANPYAEAAALAAPYTGLGTQILQGANAFEMGKTRMQSEQAKQFAMQAHADLYGAQAGKARAEAMGLEQENLNRTPEGINRLASSFAGLNEPQAREMQAYRKNGNWGVDKGYSLPVDQAGPVTPDVQKSAPQWYSPQVQSKYNMGQLAGLVNASATGKTDGVKLFEEMLNQGRIGDAMNAPNSPVFDAVMALNKASPIFNKGENVYSGALNELGKSSVKENLAKAAKEYAHAGDYNASAANRRAEIPTTAGNGVPVANFGKAPSGYRFKPDGSMEPIPGGPADAKAAALSGNKAAGVADVNSAVATLRDAYDALETGNGITNTDNGVLSNLAASSSSSAVGQAVGRAIGTKNQSERNTIAMTRPALLASLMKATGMSAKQMDSNAELKLWMATATDPTLDVQANRAALNKIEQKYLSGDSPVNTPSQDKTSLLRDAKEAINKGADRAAVIKELKRLGVDGGGL